MNKNMPKNKLRFLSLAALVLLVSGCSISFKTDNRNTNDAGVYKTRTKGEKWAQMVLVPTITGRPKNIGNVNVNALAMDPNDNKAIYWGSEGGGLFYTYDGARSWMPAYGLKSKNISAVAVDYESKCIIYAATANEVYKSTDCSRSWSRIYFDNSAKTTIGDIAIDHYDSSNVYIGTSRGEIIKSKDRGETWSVAGRFQSEIKRIIISPNDSRHIFAATKGKGVFRSLDNGETWESLKEGLKEFKSSRNFRDMAIAKDEPNTIFLASNYGLLKSRDNGDSWSKIELITPVKKAKINAIAVSPENSKEIYYVTNTTFYRSLDGGESWTTKKLPTSGAGWRLLIDPENPNIIYMGVKKFDKK